MNDEHKTKGQLINELAELHQSIAELELKLLRLFESREVKDP